MRSCSSRRKPGSKFRVLGIDDAPFHRSGPRRVRVVGVLYRGTDLLEGCLSTTVVRDGFNATDALTRMVLGRFYDQIHLIALKGVTLGGFNIVDIHRLYHETRRPVLVVMRRKPDIESVRSAIRAMSNPRRRERAMNAAGPIQKAGPLFVQCAGIDRGEIEGLLPRITSHGSLPEALRCAHIIARGIEWGESRGGA